MLQQHSVPFQSKVVKYIDHSGAVVIGGNTSSGYFATHTNDLSGDFKIVQIKGKLLDIEVRSYGSFIIGIPFSNHCLMLPTIIFKICGNHTNGTNYLAISKYSKSDPGIDLFEMKADNECEIVASLLPRTRDMPQNFVSLSYISTLAAASESGSIEVWDINQADMGSLKKFNADSCGIHAIRYANSHVLYTAGCTSRGQLRVWDIRQEQTSKPELNCIHPKSMDPLQKLTVYTCLDIHPGGNIHSVVCGSMDGTVTEWDLRNPQAPLNLFSSHVGPVTSVKFHPGFDSESKREVLSASKDGMLISTSLDRPDLEPLCHISEVAPISSLDVLESSSHCVAVSLLGGLWRGGALMDDEM